jgi:hypothetical protein
VSADAQHLQLDGVRDIQAHKSSDGFACLARTNEKTDDLQKGDRGGDSGGRRKSNSKACNESGKYSCMAVVQDGVEWGARETCVPVSNPSLRWASSQQPF